MRNALREPEAERAAGRVGEVAEILALGLVRHKLAHGRRLAGPADSPEKSLDVRAHQSVHVPKPGPEGEKP